jgi:hypothetical protein
LKKVKINILKGENDILDEQENVEEDSRRGCR